MESIVVTATRTQASVLDVAEAVSVVGAEEINRLAPELLAEMLRGVPGAFFQQTTPGQGIPIIRGLKGSQVLHLVDGMRLNNAFFRSAPNQYLGLVDAYATGRTEVIRGSAPIAYTAPTRWVACSRSSLTEPGFDSRPVGCCRAGCTAAITASTPAWSAAQRPPPAATVTCLSAGVTWQDHGDRKTGGGDTVAPSGYRVRAADAKWRYDLDDRSELMLSVQYLEQPSTPRVDELVPGYGQDHPSSEQYEFMPNRREFLHARYRLARDSHAGSAISRPTWPGRSSPMTASRRTGARAKPASEFN